MVRNVSKPSAYVLNSKLVSEPCKQFCLCCKIDPKHVQNFIEHNFRHFIRTLDQGSYIRIAHTCTHELAVRTSVNTRCISDQ